MRIGYDNILAMMESISKLPTVDDLQRVWPNEVFDCSGCRFQGRFSPDEVRRGSSSEVRFCRRTYNKAAESGSEFAKPSNMRVETIAPEVHTNYDLWLDPSDEYYCVGVVGCDKAVPQSDK